MFGFFFQWTLFLGLFAYPSIRCPLLHCHVENNFFHIFHFVAKCFIPKFSRLCIGCWEQEHSFTYLSVWRNLKEISSWKAWNWKKKMRLKAMQDLTVMRSLKKTRVCMICIYLFWKPVLLRTLGTLTMYQMVIWSTSKNIKVKIG